ncbi:MAG TPA: hypothetical protein VD706_01855 [Candidatus Saccharimonadales bacterium]|nr:hypothetical protein [Candidatus Saccharimonadales bacterium]
MNGLEQAFYIMAIIFMSLMFIMIAVIVGAVLVIRSKINRIHDAIQHKIDLVTSLAGVNTAGTQVVKQAKKVLKKAKK